MSKKGNEALAENYQREASMTGCRYHLRIKNRKN